MRLAPILKLEFGPPEFGKLGDFEKGSERGRAGASSSVEPEAETSSPRERNEASPLSIIPWLLVILAGIVYVRWRVRA